MTAKAVPTSSIVDGESSAGRRESGGVEVQNPSGDGKDSMSRMMEMFMIHSQKSMQDMFAESQKQMFKFQSEIQQKNMEYQRDLQVKVDSDREKFMSSVPSLVAQVVREIGVINVNPLNAIQGPVGSSPLLCIGSGSPTSQSQGNAPFGEGPSGTYHPPLPVDQPDPLPSPPLEKESLEETPMATLRGPQDILMDAVNISVVLAEAQQEKTEGASKETSEVDASDKVC